MAIQDEECNLLYGELESELRIAMNTDDLNRKQNEAKFRAINQNVETYNEFRDIVNAAHLKSLTKSDKIERPKTIWNTFSSKKRKKTNCERSEKAIESPRTTINQQRPKFIEVDGCREFFKKWQKLSPNDELRYVLLKNLSRDRRLEKFLASETTFGLLGDVIRSLDQHEDTVDDFVFVVSALDSLSQMKRFSLAMQFLGTEEKRRSRSLFQRLKIQMRDKLQDLAERGITEWTLQELDKKYESDQT